MFHEPDDPEEAARVRATAVQFAKLRLDELRAAAPSGSFEFAFLRRDPTRFSDMDFAILERLAWHYRRRISRFLAPKTDPDDPIVRENYG